MLLSSFGFVYGDERISEIIVSDDNSDMDIWDKLYNMYAGNKIVKLFRNPQTIGCYLNKCQAMSYVKNDFSILLDSDNVIDAGYIDKLYAIERWDVDTIYTPDFASPHFSFQAYSGLTITRNNVAAYIDLPMFETLCNAANFFCTRDSYLEVFDNTVDPVTSDSIFQVYNWLKANKKIYIVPGLVYTHTVHVDSHYQRNISRTPAGFHKNLLQKLRELR